MKRATNRKYESQKFPEILSAIKSGKYSVKKPKGSKFKRAETWEKWRLIYNEADELLKDYYYCDSCSVIYNLDVSKSGKCLKVHAMECRSEKVARIDEHFSKVFNPVKKKKISNESRNEVTQAVINFVVKDMRPISSIEGDGLNNLLSTMTSIGARYGEMGESEMNVSGILPSRQKVISKFLG